MTFRVDAIPIAQPRQRHRWTGSFVQNYTPSKHPVQAFKFAVIAAYKNAGGVAPMDGPVMLVCTFYLPRPKGMVWKTKPMPAEWHGKKPDLDNLAKSVMDALKGHAWRDDGQICDMTIRKYISPGDGAPLVDIEIYQSEHNDS